MAWPTGRMVGPFSGIGMLQKNRLGILDILDLGNIKVMYLETSRRQLNIALKFKHMVSPESTALGAVNTNGMTETFKSHNTRITV